MINVLLVLKLYLIAATVRLLMINPSVNLVELGFELKIILVRNVRKIVITAKKKGVLIVREVTT